MPRSSSRPLRAQARSSSHAGLLFRENGAVTCTRLGKSASTRGRERGNSRRLRAVRDADRRPEWFDGQPPDSNLNGQSWNRQGYSEAVVDVSGLVNTSRADDAHLWGWMAAFVRRFRRCLLECSRVSTASGSQDVCRPSEPSHNWAGHP